MRSRNDTDVIVKYVHSIFASYRGDGLKELDLEAVVYVSNGCEFAAVGAR